ncbi:lysozyme C-like [Sceloporus undulatus]|uniref:lysozyme C-like n=1 Tax=Sceloporus undulatus TaxID=8520 RepID=UPI001C4BB00A|nr:lysozyme C-like [Sceloporus undulatus]
MKALAFILFCLFIAVSEGKKFDKCELAKLLKHNEMDGYFGYSLDLYMCMIYHESGYDTKAVKRPNQDGTVNYGLFQINSRLWCSDGKNKSANNCKSSCNAFINDDIRDDIKCLKKVIRRKMSPWSPWRKKCRPNNVTGWTRDCKL